MAISARNCRRACDTEPTIRAALTSQPTQRHLKPPMPAWTGSSHISRQRGKKAARRKSYRIKCKKGRNPKSRGDVRDRLPIAQERENRTRHDHTKQRQVPESCRRRQQQRRANKLQSTAYDVKTVRKAPAREVGLYRTSPYNINDAGNDEYYNQKQP
jgi:hypothetical protein